MALISRVLSLIKFNYVNTHTYIGMERNDLINTDLRRFARQIQTPVSLCEGTLRRDEFRLRRHLYGSTSQRWPGSVDFEGSFDNN